VIDSIVAQYQRLDERSSLQYFWNSPQFLSVGDNGPTSGFEALKSGSEWCDSALSSNSFKPLREDFPIVTKDVVVYSFVSKSQIIYKTGDRMNVDNDAETYVFRKIDGNWKIVFVQYSGTVTKQKAGKK